MRTIHYFRKSLLTALLFSILGASSLAFTQDAVSNSYVEDLLDSARKALDSNIEEAPRFIDDLLSIGESNKDTNLIIQAEKLLSGYYDEKGDLNLRFASNLRILSLARAMNSPENEIIALRQLSRMYITMGENEKAVESIEKAAEISKKCSISTQIDVLTGAAMTYARLDSTKDARKLFSHALMLANKNATDKSKAIILANWGRMEKDLGVFPKSRDLLTQALELAQSQNDLGGQAFIYAQLADLYAKTGDDQQALQSTLKSHEAALAQGGLENIVNSATDVSRAYERLDQPTEALRYARLATEMSDSIQREALRESLKSQAEAFDLARMRALQEQERQQEELRKQLNRQTTISLVSAVGILILILLALLLRRKTVQSGRANASLQTEVLLRQRSEEELNLFLYKSSHDLQGPVKTLEGLLDMLKQYLSHPEGLYLYEMSVEKVQQMDNLINRLLKSVAIIQTDFPLEWISFGRVWEKAMDQLKSLPEFDATDIQLEGEVNQLVFQNEHVSTLVIRNLVENSLIFRDPDQRDPWIKVTFSVEGNNHSLIVEDNGIGMSPKVLSKATEMFYRGSILSRGNGLGLYLVDKVSRKLSSEIDIQSVEGKGTTVKLAWHGPAWRQPTTSPQS